MAQHGLGLERHRMLLCTDTRNNEGSCADGGWGTGAVNLLSLHLGKCLSFFFFLRIVSGLFLFIKEHVWSTNVSSLSFSVPVCSWGSAMLCRGTGSSLGQIRSRTQHSSLRGHPLYTICSFMAICELVAQMDKKSPNFLSLLYLFIKNALGF